MRWSFDPVSPGESLPRLTPYVRLVSEIRRALDAGATASYFIFLARSRNAYTRDDVDYLSILRFQKRYRSAANFQTHLTRFPPN
jgi:hypothetical protein